MDSQILLYAELLPNIRQISLAVSLPSLSDASTRVTIAADGVEVKLAHRGEVRTLRLPAKAALGAVALPVQKFGVETLSWRLPLDAKAPADAGALQQRTALWSATDLQVGSDVCCRQCKSPVVNHGTTRVWKDLPSENWAEMMEFWHCHKPGETGNHSHGPANSEKADETTLATRGYGASSTISAQRNVGFVDLTTLLFDEHDCHGITVSSSCHDFRFLPPFL